MIDTADGVILIHPDFKNTAKRYWTPDVINENPGPWEYGTIYHFDDLHTGVRMTYWEEMGNNNPSRIRIQYSSLPKFIHGNNVMYFTTDDLDAFDRKMGMLFQRAHISEPFDAERLIIVLIDISFNLHFLDPTEPVNIVNALKSQVCLSQSHPLVLEEFGIYARSLNRKYPDLLTTHRNGPFIYIKTRHAHRAGLFPGQGILRFESKYCNKQTVDRVFGKNIKLPELFKSRELIKKACTTSLKHMQITKGNRLKSRQAVMLDLFGVEHLRSQVHPWGLDNQLMGDELFYGCDEQDRDLLPTAKEINWFRNKILNAKLGVLHAVLDDDDEHEYQLHDMFMTEIDNYFNGTSIFIK